MAKHPFRELLLIFVIWTAGMFFAGTLFEVYFYNLGMSVPEIYLADTIWFLTSLLLVPFFKRFNTKAFMLIGIAISFLSALVLFVFPDPNAAYLYRLILGSTHFFFWMPFNVEYFKFKKQNAATLGAIYFAVIPFLSLVLPAVSGTVASGFGFQPLFILAMASYAAAFIAAVIWVKGKEYKYDFIQSMRYFAGLRTVTFLEGFSVMAIGSITLPVMLLFFVHEPIEYGWFLSLVTIFSLVASFLVSQLSDKYHKRGTFLLPSAAAFAISSILASAVNDILVFFIAFGLINFFIRLFSPISIAWALDNSKDLACTMVAREFMLNLGRLAGGLLGFALFIAFGIEAALLVQGLIMLLYPPIFELKKAKLQRIG